MPRKPEKIIEPINAPFEEVVRAVVMPKQTETAVPETFEKIIHNEGKLDLGGTTVFCHVTESKKRLLSARKMQEALRIVDAPTTSTGRQVPGNRLDRFLGQNHLIHCFI